MSLIAVLAHFDPHGLASPHVLRHLDALGEVADRVLVVSSAPLTAPARAELAGRAELVERENAGYDFSSWQAGLARVPWTTATDVLLANDSVIGPLVPYSRILDRMRAAGAPAWGITTSREGEPHLQSYLLGLRGAAIRSPLVQAFWRGLAPATDRNEAIWRYEFGFSRLLATAGLAGVPYFTPTAWDDKVGRRRRARLAALQQLEQRSKALAELGTPISGARGILRETTRELRRRELTNRTWSYLRPTGVYNPMIALWDRALDGRLPFVKLETLRDDPYRLGGEAMLAALEKAQPAALAGVREHLERTRPDYLRMGRGRVGTAR